MEIKITPQQVVDVAGCSLRSAYNYLGGHSEWPPKIAAAVEKAYGISRLWLLYPAEYDRAGKPRGA